MLILRIINAECWYIVGSQCYFLCLLFITQPDRSSTRDSLPLINTSFKIEMSLRRLRFLYVISSLFSYITLCLYLNSTSKFNYSIESSFFKDCEEIDVTSMCRARKFSLS